MSKDMSKGTRKYILGEKGKIDMELIEPYASQYRLVDVVNYHTQEDGVCGPGDTTPQRSELNEFLTKKGRGQLLGVLLSHEEHTEKTRLSFIRDLMIGRRVVSKHQFENIVKPAMETAQEIERVSEESAQLKRKARRGTVVAR